MKPEFILIAVLVVFISVIATIISKRKAQRKADDKKILDVIRKAGL